MADQFNRLEQGTPAHHAVSGARLMFVLISPRLPIQTSDFLGSGVPYWPTELAVFASFLREKGEAVHVADLFGSAVKTLEEKEDHYLQGQSIRAHLSTDAFLLARAFIIY